MPGRDRESGSRPSRGLSGSTNRSASLSSGRPIRKTGFRIRRCCGAQRGDLRRRAAFTADPPSLQFRAVFPSPAMLFPKQFDVIVVGGGHAGSEAALAAARMGAATLLLTHNIETLGQMSCNPSIGGIGKGHLVKEVDALGGAMAAATDEAGIQFRILNSSKGPAVRATRAQADRVLYRKAIRTRLENQSNLLIFQQSVDDLTIDGERVTGVVTQLGLR